MKYRKISVCTAIFGWALLIPLSASPQNMPASHQVSARPASAGSAEAPPDPHQLLAKLAGEYTRVIKFVGQGDIPPSAGTAKISIILGGKFLREESSDVVFGRPVDGLRIYGYDDAAGQYQMARMYTMSNAITMMKGTSSDGGKTIDFAGETEAMKSGNLPLHARLIRIDDNQFSVTLSTVGADGKESPFQETDYTRKK